ncbi:MAG: hypothetical protein JJE52_18595 [Acidimicrobiia bacterium]|nr:hypothetical protein [Acidimicrobiia bacterium]
MGDVLVVIWPRPVGRALVCVGDEAAVIEGDDSVQPVGDIAFVGDHHQRGATGESAVFQQLDDLG